jgi:Zn-dependent protease with chaperone function/TPR repeat protein
VNVISAAYFDGRSSVRHEVSLLAGNGRLKVVGRDVDLEYDLRRVRRSLRIANTPRWLYLPGGGACVTADNDAVDRMTRAQRYERVLHRFESHPGFAAFAVVLVVLTAWLLSEFALPIAAQAAAGRIPVQAEAELGRRVLEGLEERLLHESQLPASRRRRLLSRFYAMAEAANEATIYRIEFRSGRLIGPNAFALPGGTIVVTDELVWLAKRDEEVLGVLAHELGHVRHRHSMRRLIEGSISALLVAAITGDVSSTASLAAAAPTLLLQAKYSRENEREADAFAIELMGRGGHDPRHLAAILERMEQGAERRIGMPTFLSSHPATEERKALASAASTAPAAEPKAEETTEPEKRRLAELDPGRRVITALLARRDFDALDRLLALHQQAFEHDPSASRPLESAYPAFRLLPDDQEAVLSEWIERMPASYAARVARGNYYLWRGLEARGSAFSANTPPERMSAMRRDLDKARADLEASIPLAQKPFMSHFSLMTIARYLGARERGERHYREAVKLGPQSIALRLDRMSSLEPRWGGNLADMEAFAVESSAQLTDPAAAARVAARVPAYRAWERFYAKEYKQALALYDESVRLHADSETLCERSHVLSELKRDAEAFADVTRALAIDRNSEYCLDRAIRAAGGVQDWRGIVALMNAVLEVEPTSAGAYRERAWAHYELAQPNLAFQDYLTAAKMGDPVGQAKTGRFYLNGIGVKPDREQARAWLRKSAAQGNAEAVSLLEHMKRQTAGK